MRILLVEDSGRVSESICAALRSRGWTVTAADTAARASALIGEKTFDVAVVDIGLPDQSGLEWCIEQRRAGTDTPILFLTARTSVKDRVAGLEAGADDYLGKPFAMDELVARVVALSRRAPRWTGASRRYGKLVVDRERRAVFFDGNSLSFTTRELDVVFAIAWRDGRVISRDELLETVWGEVTERAAGSLEVLLVRIRRKLAEHGLEAIRTARNLGYAWALEASKLD